MAQALVESGWEDGAARRMAENLTQADLECFRETCEAHGRHVESLVGEAASLAQELEHVDGRASELGRPGMEFNRLGLPTLILFKSGEPVERTTSARSRADIEALLAPYF